MARIVIEEPCEHGEPPMHPLWQAGQPVGFCPGGSRRVLDPGSYVLIEKVDGEWQGIDNLLRLYGIWLNGDRIITMGEVISMERTLDELAGGEQP